MKLITNGCSFTWGGGFYDYPDYLRETMVWPHHLGALLQAKQVVNLSSGCGSNQRIFRTTLNYILSTPKKDLENAIAVIQFTDSSRYEFYLPSSVDRFENIEENWAKAKVDVLLVPTHKMYDELYRLTQERISMHTPIEGLYQTISIALSLQYIFNLHNIKHYFWTIDLKDYPNNLNNIIDEINFIDYHDCWEYERISLEDPHPSIVGHKQIANYVFKAIKNYD